MPRPGSAIVVAVAAAVLVGCGTALAAQAPAMPAQANAAIRACALQAGAARVRTWGGAKGGTAYFPGVYKWASWSYVVVNGYVAALESAGTVGGALKRKMARCYLGYGADSY